MRELYNISWEKASKDAIETIMEQTGVSRALAEKALKNTLLYNCVIDEILGQAMFLLGIDNDVNA